MQWTSYTCALDEVRGKLGIQLLEGTNGVGCQPAKPYSGESLQRGREGFAHDLVWHPLKVHQGLEGLQVI